MSVKEIEVKDFKLRKLQVQTATLENSIKHLTTITTSKNSTQILSKYRREGNTS